MNGLPGEGDLCPDCGEASLQFADPGNCSCSSSPPDVACTSSVLACVECGWEAEL